jgi:CheY-like chemotaxis protein
MSEFVDEILYVDDSPDDRLFAEHRFRRGSYSFQLKMFNTGFAAILDMERRLARGESLPRLLVVDHYMPVMDGPELLRLVRANAGFADILLAVCSGGDDPADLRTAKDAGAQIVLAKPLDLNLCGDILAGKLPAPAR